MFKQGKQIMTTEWNANAMNTFFFLEIDFSE